MSWWTRSSLRGRSNQCVWCIGVIHPTYSSFLLGPPSQHDRRSWLSESSLRLNASHVETERDRDRTVESTVDREYSAACLCLRPRNPAICQRHSIRTDYGGAVAIDALASLYVSSSVAMQLDRRPSEAQRRHRGCQRADNGGGGRVGVSALCNRVTIASVHRPGRRQEHRRCAMIAAPGAVRMLNQRYAFVQTLVFKLKNSIIKSLSQF